MSLAHSKQESFKLFNDISRRYDFINSVLSFGLHYRWRKAIRETLPRKNGLQVLDIATGTADVALELIKSPHVAHVDGIDLSEGMIAQGQVKVAKRGREGKIKLAIADGQKLPFPDRSFEAVTISFGIRNIPDTKKCISECYRVLKPGGRLIILEFALPSSKVMRKAHLFYLRRILPGIGKALSGNDVAYRYLNETIEEFPYGEKFTHMMEQCGFDTARFEELSMGIVNLYWGDKN